MAIKMFSESEFMKQVTVVLMLVLIVLMVSRLVVVVDIN